MAAGQKMQVVQLNMIVSSESNKFNQVLSGFATISWLFEPSGPCCSKRLVQAVISQKVSTTPCRKRETNGGMSAGDIVTPTSELLKLRSIYK